MSLLLAVAGIALLLLPGALAPAARRVAPAEWARLTAGALWLGWHTIHLALLVMAAPVVLRAAGLHSVADACHRVVGPLMPGGTVTGTAAGLGLVVLVGRGRSMRVRALRQQRAARVEHWLGEHRRVGDVDFVVLPTPQVVAYATSGPPRQVVVSAGLVEALSEDELAAVVRHERAHLDGHHEWYLLVVAIVEGALGWLPGVHRTTAFLRLSLERWADEVAAEAPGSRESTRRALGKAAESLLGAVPAFAAPCTILERLEALDDPAPRPHLYQRAAVAGPLLAASLIVVASLVVWTTYTHHGVLGVLGSCPL